MNLARPRRDTAPEEMAFLQKGSHPRSVSRQLVDGRERLLAQRALNARTHSSRLRACLATKWDDLVLPAPCLDLQCIGLGHVDRDRFGAPGDSVRTQFAECAGGLARPSHTDQQCIDKPG